MDVKVNFKAGGSFVHLPPQFSSNAENVYVAWKNQILGYNTKTGMLIGEFKGIKDRIVGFGIHYYESYECITACSCSGEVITWKIVTYFKMINKKITRENVSTFHIATDDQDTLKALISFRHKNKVSFEIFDLIKETSEHCGPTLSAQPHSVDVCFKKYFAVVQKSALNIVMFDNLLKTYTFCIDKPRQFTCLACHPEKEIILTGDNTGRVVVWQRIMSKQPSKAVFHWHTLPVKCLGFSTTGSYFYSGGDESVLVRWQLDNKFEKRYLPRLPSTIAQLTVSPNNMFIAVATTDNAVRIIDSKFDDVSLIQNLVIGDTLETGIVVDPRTKALMMNGNVGQIQFYSCRDNCLLYSVDVVGQNKISNERSCAIENTRVTKVAVNNNGFWMATVEYRKDLEYSSELRMKFWNFDFSIQKFKLNTSVEDPHEKQIHSIAFQPTESTDELKLVSVGGDKKFKVWYLSEVETVEKKSKIWSCLCVGFYHDLPCRDLSFSVDGSLVAVSFDRIVTAWLPDSCELKCALVHPVCKAEITQVEFGTSNQCHLLVTASSERLCVWNLLTLTMLWSVTVNVQILIADPVTANMAVITEDKMVFVFSPSSLEPIFSSDKILKKHKSIYAASFVPSKYSNDSGLWWYQRSPIFFIDSKRELFCLGSMEESSDTPTDVVEVSASLYSMTIPQNDVNKNRGREPVRHLYQQDIGQKSMKKYLEAPIQTMIPIRIMCGSLLRSMVLQKS